MVRVPDGTFCLVDRDDVADGGQNTGVLLGSKLISGVSAVQNCETGSGLLGPARHAWLGPAG